MTKRRQYRPGLSPEERLLGTFGVGELLPIKHCWLRVAHVEPGVLVLSLDGYTARGKEVLEQLRAEAAAASVNAYANNDTNTPVSPPDGDGTKENHPSGTDEALGQQSDAAAAPDIPESNL